MPYEPMTFQADYQIPDGRSFKKGEVWPWHHSLHLAKTLLGKGILKVAERAVKPAAAKPQAEKDGGKPDDS